MQLADHQPHTRQLGYRTDHKTDSVIGSKFSALSCSTRVDPSWDADATELTAERQVRLCFLLKEQDPMEGNRSPE